MEQGQEEGTKIQGEGRECCICRKEEQEEQWEKVKEIREKVEENLEILLEKALEWKEGERRIKENEVNLED